MKGERTSGRGFSASTAKGWIARSSTPLPKRKQLVALEEGAEERRRFVREADDLVRRLTIEFEIELSPGLPVSPIGETAELGPAQRPLGDRCAADGEAHA